MPVGDSITAGSTELRAYRYWLSQLLAAARIPSSFVGEHDDYAVAPAYSGHNGNGGWCTTAYEDFYPGEAGTVCTTSAGTNGVLQHIDGWLDAKPADMVLLLIGANDHLNYQHASSPLNTDQGVADRVGETIDKVHSHNANSIVFVSGLHLNVGNPPYYPTSTANKNRLIKAAVESRPNAVYLDAYEGFNDPADFDNEGDGPVADGVHPGPSGAQKIAKNWLTAIQRYLQNGL